MRWTKNGPNVYVTAHGHEFYIGENDKTGRFHLSLGGMPRGTFSTMIAAKRQAQNLANKIGLAQLVKERKAKQAPRTHDEDLAGALEERALHIPEARKRQQPHEFVTGRRSRGRTGEAVCDRCGKTRFEGAHPLPTKREIAQKQREEVDQLLRNAEQDFNSLESNVQDIEVADNKLTKSQKQRLQSLKEDIENLLEQWP